MKLCKMLERLAEMFPKQDYQIKLERYLVSKNPQSISDVENWSRDFLRNSNKGLFQ